MTLNQTILDLFGGTAVDALLRDHRAQLVTLALLSLGLAWLARRLLRPSGSKLRTFTVKANNVVEVLEEAHRQVSAHLPNPVRRQSRSVVHADMLGAPVPPRAVHAVPARHADGCLAAD